MRAACTVLIAILAAPALAQDRPPRAPQTDQTVPAARGSRLAISNFAGEVAIRAWDRDELRVQARHSLRTRINIRTTDAGLAVSASASTGPPGAVDYEISVPAWMPIKIDGQFNFVTVEGTSSDVAAETVRGDIAIKGGSGFVSAKSVEGKVSVEGTRGRVEAHSVNEGITVSGSTGEILAETINGPITLSGIDSGNVDAGTVNGDITYDGTADEKGRYRFTTHNGDIVVTLPVNASALFSVRTYNGDFSSSLPVKGEGDPRRGRRVTYTLGTGSAEFELESFGGAIRLQRAERQ
jgi:DUF4097 and DUF4098 domain-containing protein YvlB